jgi:hypothetical protein
LRESPGSGWRDHRRHRQINESHEEVGEADTGILGKGGVGPNWRARETLPRGRPARTHRT